MYYGHFAQPRQSDGVDPSYTNEVQGTSLECKQTVFQGMDDSDSSTRQPITLL